MKTHILTGTRAEIVAQLSEIEGAIQKVVVIVEKLPPPSPAPLAPGEDMFAEMRPYMVDVDLDDVDFSREAIYTRFPGE